MRPNQRPTRWPLLGSILILNLASARGADPGVSIESVGDRVKVAWPIAVGEEGRAEFNLDPARPLIASLAISTPGGPSSTIAVGLNPVATLTVGSRDLKNPAGWVAFFDNPPMRPHETFPILLGPRRAVVIADLGSRATVSVAEVSAGRFRGDLRFTFYRNSPLIQAEAVVTTAEDGRAIVYDLGFTGAKPGWEAVAWRDPAGMLQRTGYDPGILATPLAVSGRAIAAESRAGAMAVFPAPHRYFYPQDEAYNLQFVWYGRDFGGRSLDGGIGIRQSLTGDKRFVPWFNAPPGTEQHLGVFLLLTRGDGRRALDAVARYTHGDRYEPLPGHKTFTSHYHVEHTLEFLAKQKQQGTSGVPTGLEVPGMVTTFKARGVDIVHLAEFHNGETPRLGDEKRLSQLKLLHDECARLSGDRLLILPGEEANVHLGGHWLSFFPKPVHWVLNRPPGKPFVEQFEGFGKVYRVGSPEDVLRLMEAEGGLMWTAHPRIKGSIGFPDRYWDRVFFRSDHFLGAAWKAMPADLSRSTLGWRALDLFDDMNNRGARKQILGEADLFRMEPDFETYAHMNINYLQLDTTPRFADGWRPVLDALRGGRFFTTTGEILLTDFKVNGKESGQTLDPGEALTVMVEARVAWTFPMAFVEIVAGDGKEVFRQRIDLSDFGEFGAQTIRVPITRKELTWVRFEAWDVAANGAFTQPVWIGPVRPGAR